MKIFTYKKCSQTRKAIRSLNLAGLFPEVFDFVLDKSHLEIMLKLPEIASLQADELVNRRSKLYREEKLAETWSDKSEDEKMRMLIEKPLLIKRPILISGKNIVFGLDLAGYRQLFLENEEKLGIGKGSERVWAFLNKIAKEERIVEADHPLESPEEIASYFKVEQDRVVKVWPCDLGKRTGLILTAADHEIKPHLFKRRFGRKLSFIPDDELGLKTGYDKYSLCPFANPSDCNVYVDESLNHADPAKSSLIVSAGDPRKAIELSYAELRAWSNSRCGTNLCTEEKSSIYICYRDAAACPKVGWAGGFSSELLIMPANSSYRRRNFLIRASTATIKEREILFTKLPGVQRLLIPLESTLDFAIGEIKKKVEKYEIFAFDGSRKMKCLGTGRDFNLMLKKGSEGKLRVLRERKRHDRNYEKDSEILFLYNHHKEDAYISLNYKDYIIPRHSICLIAFDKKSIDKIVPKNEDIWQEVVSEGKGGCDIINKMKDLPLILGELALEKTDEPLESKR